MSAATSPLEALLDRMDQAAEHNDWDSLATLDQALRETVAQFSPDAEPARIQQMLNSLERAKKVYTHVLHMCQRRQTEIRKESQTLQRGRKAAHNYLSGQNSLHYGNS
jgi:DNA-binding GntR family transcriptional regulator